MELGRSVSAFAQLTYLPGEMASLRQGLPLEALAPVTGTAVTSYLGFVAVRMLIALLLPDYQLPAAECPPVRAQI